MRPFTQYLCPICNQAEDTAYEARICCPVEVDEVYGCGECEKTFEDRDDANHCCDPCFQPEPLPAAAPTAAELEALGQNRIFN